MANFLTANLVKYQAKITQMFQASELRFRNPAVFNFMRRSTEIMIPTHNDIKSAAKRTTGEVNFMDRQSRSLGTSGEVYNHTGVKGDSTVLVPSWTAYDDKMYYSLKQANESVFSLDDEVLTQMMNININFAEGLESAAATYIHSNRSGVNGYARQGTFNTTNDVFEITEDDTNFKATGFRAVQIMKTAMDANKWRGWSFTAICDTLMFDKLEAIAAQGSGNSDNLTFQFSGMNFIKSVELDALAVALGYTDGYCVVIPEGQVATLDWIPVQNRQAIQTKVNKYGTIIHPPTGLTLATHEYEARADESGNNSQNQDVKFEVQAFDYISFNHAPLTTSNETPLQAFAFVSEGGA
ncbi:MAG: hypothetical protein GY834_00445 [Bacteroidetes bacterium]|nr:hypothetical protein [Bacteroidota bacterium]